MTWGNSQATSARESSDAAFLDTAVRAGMVAQRWMKIPDHFDPAEGALLLTGLRGTVAEVVELYRLGGVVAA